MYHSSGRGDSGDNTFFIDMRPMYYLEDQFSIFFVLHTSKKDVAGLKHSISGFQELRKEQR
jgi:hypothetical protein